MVQVNHRDEYRARRLLRLVYVAAVSSIFVLLSLVGYALMHKNTLPPSNVLSQAIIQEQAHGAHSGIQQKPLAHLFIIMEENHAYEAVMGSNQAPYINSLAKQYALVTNYQAVSHPSLPNYLALTSGSTNGITSDCNPPSAGCIVNAPNITDEIERSGRTWKAYVESMPSPCYAFNSGEYVTKHNPFVYYGDIINNNQRCVAHDVPFGHLQADLGSVSTTPNFAFIVPNLCDDSHDCPLSSGDSWLADHVPAILNSPAFKSQPSALIITWDESETGDNHVPLILAGSAIKQAYQSSQAYTHYSLLHTIENLWQLKPLTTNDASAASLQEFFTL